MKKIIELESRLKVRLITGEFEILSWLYFNGPTRSRDLARKTKSSTANYQIIVRRLREDGVILNRDDCSDGRARIYDLAPPVREEFARMFNEDDDSRAILCRIGSIGSHA